MQIKVGQDILEIKRFAAVYEKKGERFLERFLSSAEITYATKSIQSLAGFFAAKEAAAKALGTGIGHERVTWHDFHITVDSYGKPQLELSGAALEYYNKIKGISLDLSISHEKKYATAVCVILTEQEAGKSK